MSAVCLHISCLFTRQLFDYISSSWSQVSLFHFSHICLLCRPLFTFHSYLQNKRKYMILSNFYVLKILDFTRCGIELVFMWKWCRVLIIQNANFVIWCVSGDRKNPFRSKLMIHQKPLKKLGYISCYEYAVPTRWRYKRLQCVILGQGWLKPKAKCI